MSTVTGPYSVTANESLTLTDPTPGWSTRVQIQNGTAYSLTVTSGVGTTEIGPNTAGTVPSQGGAGIQIVVGATGANGNGILAVWLLPADRPATPDGPLVTSLNVNATITSGTVDIGNTPSVTIASGTIDVAGNVQIVNPGGTNTISVATAPGLNPVTDFGTGTDGAVTISANTTLSQDMNYTTLVVNAGVTLNTNGWAVRATTSITNNGTIDNSASGTTPGATNSLGGGAAAITTGPAAGISPLSATFQGGSGGTVGTYQGGQTGPLPATSSQLFATGTISGGGSGATSSSGAFAGTGAGGGAVLLMSPTVGGSGTVSANGSAYSGGTSGGGGGGMVVIACKTYNAGMTISVTGGAGSLAANKGDDGRVVIYHT